MKLFEVGFDAIFSLDGSISDWHFETFLSFIPMGSATCRVRCHDKPGGQRCDQDKLPLNSLSKMTWMEKLKWHWHRDTQAVETVALYNRQICCWVNSTQCEKFKSTGIKLNLCHCIHAESLDIQNNLKCGNKPTNRHGVKWARHRSKD